MSDEFDEKAVAGLAGIFKQAQELQSRFKRLQEEAGEKTVEASAGGGMVRVVVDGLMRVRKLEIDPALVNDLPMLQDLVVAAVNDGLRRAQELVSGELGKLNPFANLKLPGMGGD
jgi:DNA-binding YbaB/EbfC family protein